MIHICKCFLRKQFYSAIIESILCTSITVWFSSATKSDLRRLRRVVRTAERIIGESPEWAKGLVKSLWTLTSSTLPLWTVPSGRRTELWAPERPDTETVSFPKQSWTLILNMEHKHYYTIIYSSHTLIFHFKFAHSRPVHTQLSSIYCVSAILYIAYLYMFFYIYVLLLSLCCAVELLSLKQISRMCKYTWPIKLILILRSPAPAACNQHSFKYTLHQTLIVRSTVHLL